MSQTRVRTNLFFKVLGETASRAGTFALYAAGARLLGSAEFGVFSLATSFSLFLIILNDLGINWVIMREVARDHVAAARLVPTVTTFKLLLIPAPILAAAALAKFAGYENRFVLLTAILGFSALFASFMDFQSAILSGIEKMDVEAKLKFAARTAAVTGAVVGWLMRRDVYGFSIGLVTAQTLAVLWGFRIIHGAAAPLRFVLDKSVLAGLFRSGAPMFVAWSLLNLYDNQDLLILSRLGFSNQDIGAFAGSAKIIDALRPIPVLFMGALFPILAQMFVADRAALAKRFLAILRFSTVALFPFCLICSAGAPLIARIILGVKFAATGPVLAIAIWGFFFIFLNLLVLQMLVITGRERHFLIGAVFVTAANAVLCILFFKRFGLTGGAWALIAGESALFVVNILSAVRSIPMSPLQLVKTLAVPFGLCAATGAAFYFFQNRMAPFRASVAALALYAVAVDRFQLMDWSIFKKA